MFLFSVVYVLVAVVTIPEQGARHSEHRSYGDDGDACEWWHKEIDIQQQ